MSDDKLTAAGFECPRLADELLGGGRRCRAKFIRILDGDTFECVLELHDALPLVRAKCRLSLADTPETYRPSSEEERAAGLRATAHVSELLLDRVATVSLHGLDNFGRVLINVHTADIADFSMYLINNGFATPYRR